MVPLAPERFALQLTIGEATRGKLLRAQALLRHQVPSGDLEQVLDRALDALLEKVEARRFGQVKAPRAGRTKARAGTAEAPRPGTAEALRAESAEEARVGRVRRSSRYVPREVRRRVVARDGARCSFVGEDGRRCEEIGFLELDHVLPVVRGGQASVAGVRVLCRAHNQYEAERILGREVVEAGRMARATEAQQARARGVLVVTGGRREAGRARSCPAHAWQWWAGISQEPRPRWTMNV